MWIVSRDKIFARALQIALVRAGFAEPSLTASLPEAPHLPLVVDLDDFDAPTHAKAVTFAASPDRRADFTRPFLMSEFTALCKSRFAIEPASASSSAPASDPLPAEPSRPLLLLSDGGVLLNGQTVPLSPSERALLKLLLAHEGECVPKNEIDRLWSGGGNMTEVYIRYLRKKLDEPSGLRLIRTVRGKGYILCLPNTTR